MGKSRSVDIRAAGAVVWRRNGRKVEVLLVHRPRWEDWSFPKGKLKNGETLRQCCVREIKEETGADIVLGVPLGRCHYETPDGNWKEVRYWLATEADPDNQVVRRRPKVKPAPKSEIDEVRWVPVKQAKAMVTNDDDRDLLGRMRDLWSDDKLVTTPLILVRHTRAQKRSAWKNGKGSEETRPLTSTGLDRADMLVPELGAYGVDKVASSPWKRCMDTVKPYAKAVGTEIQELPELTEHAHKKAPKKVARYVKDLLRKEQHATALCLHRPTLPTVMDALAEFTPHAIMRQIPKSDPWLKTGEIIVAHVANRHGKAPTVVAFEKTRPAID